MNPFLTLFASRTPCWDEETLRLSGDEPAILNELVREGLIEPTGQGW